MHRFFLFVLILLCVCGLTVSAYAEELPEAIPETTTEVTTVAAESTDTWVTEVSAALKEFVPEIIGTGSLIVSIVLMLLFKKGLIPSVEKVMTAIFGALNKHNEGAERLLRDAAEELKWSKEFTEKVTERMTVQDEEVKQVLSAASKILLAQSDSLFDLLEHTNLPADLKAEISAKHKEQLREISALIGGKDAE